MLTWPQVKRADTGSSGRATGGLVPVGIPVGMFESSVFVNVFVGVSVQCSRGNVCSSVFARVFVGDVGARVGI